MTNENRRPLGWMGLGLEEVGARATVDNGRGNDALRKAGTVSQGVIAHGLVLNGRLLNQAVPADGRPRRKIVWDLRTH